MSPTQVGEAVEYRFEVPGLMASAESTVLVVTLFPYVTWRIEVLGGIARQFETSETIRRNGSVPWPPADIEPGSREAALELLRRFAELGQRVVADSDITPKADPAALLAFVERETGGAQ